jgi:hypothetical protein
METAADDARVGLAGYRPWFYAAAAYNLIWGAAVTLRPSWLFEVLGIDQPNYLPLWQVVGMFVLVFAPAYWWAGRFPERHAHLIASECWASCWGRSASPGPWRSRASLSSSA